MTPGSIRLALIFWLRRFPGPYRILRRVQRGVVNFVIGSLRRLVPVRFHWGPPKGFISEYELLQKGKLPGRVLFASQIVPAIEPDSLRKVCGLGQGGYQPWPAFWTHHREARLVGKTLVLLDEQKRLSLEGAFGPSAISDPAYRSIFLPRAKRLNGNWTSVTSRWGDGYYHWLMDALPRLALLPEIPADTRIIVPARLASFQRDTLQWLGLENRIRPTEEKHLLVENYYFSSPTSMTGCYSPFAVQFLRRAFLQRADMSYDSPRRFYLQRVTRFRSFLNEQEVLEYFRKRGWGIVDTEQLPLCRQIRLFAEAEMICAPHGAGLTNLLWCRPDCKVLELCASTYLNGVFEGIAQCVGVKHRYLIFKADETYRARVDLKAVERALEF